MDIATIISLILTALTVFLGGAWAIAKGKLSQVKNLGKEALDVYTAAVDAVEDNKVTPEEVAIIKAEAAEAKRAFLILIGKETV